MRPIPEKHKRIIDSDEYYQRCCLTGECSGPSVKIDIHHAWEYAGRQISELWNYMPVWSRKHRPDGDENAVHRCRRTKEIVKYLALKRATPEELAKYPKINWRQELNFLSKKYESSQSNNHGC